eukprot:TRINITY_DN2363_c0_g1_i1.p2 TRINITY_DN2363_c0_g1~~TRINITY_DN2363_c0_g1_i1.p2  ORF type:complete len:379 (-),score=80.36 TRINITY_DN2363_c0_g1_i1:593-1729(-)
MQLEFLCCVTRYMSRRYVTLAQLDLRAEGDVHEYPQIGISVVTMRGEQFSCKLVNGAYDVVARTSFWPKREVSCEVKLPPLAEGFSYIVIPSTYFVGVEADFTLRIASTEPIDFQPLRWPLRSVQLSGEWKGANAGGRFKTASTTFCANPQYVLTASEPNTHVYIFLSQDRKEPLVGVGVSVIQQHPPHRLSDTSHATLLGEAVFSNAREVCREVTLPAAGSYLLVPCTFDAKMYSGYTLEVLCEQPVELVEAPAAPKGYTPPARAVAAPAVTTTTSAAPTRTTAAAGRGATTAVRPAAGGRTTAAPAAARTAIAGRTAAAAAPTARPAGRTGTSTTTTTTTTITTTAAAGRGRGRAQPPPHMSSGLGAMGDLYAGLE